METPLLNSCGKQYVNESLSSLVLQMEEESHLFQAYLYFSCYFYLWLMLAMWWLLHVSFRRYITDYDPQRFAFNPCAQLDRFTVRMGLLLVTCIAVFIALLGIFPHSAVVARFIAPLVPLIVYPALILAMLERHDDVCDSLKRITSEALYFSSRDGLNFRGAFVVDLLTSLTKALSDFTCAWCRFFYGDKDPALCAKQHYGAVSLAMSLPYLIRLYQCLTEARYEVVSKRGPILNAVKYICSLFIVIFSGLQAGGVIDHHTPTGYICIFLAVLFSIYTTVWDIAVDWELHRRAETVSLNQLSRYKLVFYIWVGISDTLLRFSWLYTCFLTPPYPSLVVLGIAIAEILRRYQWAYFGVEREAEGYYGVSVSPRSYHPMDLLS